MNHQEVRTTIATYSAVTISEETLRKLDEAAQRLNIPVGDILDHAVLNWLAAEAPVLTAEDVRAFIPALASTSREERVQ